MKKLLFSPIILVFALTQLCAQVPQSLFSNLKWRNIGPFRGGRSLAVTGHPDQPSTWYFGATGGGVWKTTDGGQAWNCISDSTFGSSSVGCIAVAPSDPNTIYIGMGETEMRGNISFGDGMYKSNDAGKTWKKIGLEKSFAIGRIVVHPKNPDLLYVAVLGKIFGQNRERGVYRSKDGGNSWEQVLAKDDKTGAIDVVFDPNNPLVLYASLWQCYRNNHMMSSGGEGSGLYKTTDGGNSWQNISQKPGLPVGILGKIEISVAHKNSNRVWAMVENQKGGGLFRSEDGGENWAQINTDKNLRQRPWYFSEIAVDPTNDDALFVLNVGFWKTTDAGKTFSQIQVQHGDCHDIWINPKNSQNFILGDDGGAEITYDGGRNFTQLDLPTAQFYHVSLDNDFPYHAYGAQQDNSSIRIKTRNTEDFNIDHLDWEVVSGGESGYVVSDPTNSDIVYGGNYQGEMEKWNLKTGQRQQIAVNPMLYLGAGAEAMKYRFQWTYPLVFSPHDAKTLYATSQYVHKTTNGGMSWEIISPILTRNDPTTLISSGGPITKDNTGAETFSTIFTFAESSLKQGLFWAGSDDGWLHISQDGGKKWDKLTVQGLPDWALMSIIEASHFDAGTAYLAANRYKLDDNKPYLFKTNDFGKTWKLITTGLPNQAYCRVIREDPNKKGLLYAGTEMGIFVSFDDGNHWQPLSNNLPLTPIHDIAIHARDRDLVVATHGRSFWVLDHLEPLYQIVDNQKIADKKVHLFKPENAYKVGGGAMRREGMQVGENAFSGVTVHYWLKNKVSDEITLTFFDAQKDTVMRFSNLKDKKGKAIEVNANFYQKEKIERSGILTAASGLNGFEWDTRYADATDTEGTPALMWSGSVVGPKAAPGQYRVELAIGKEIVGSETFEIKKDPRLSVSDDDLKESLKFQLKVRDKLSAIHKGVNDLRSIRKQTNDYLKSVQDTIFKKELEKVSKPMLDSLQSVENQLIQHEAKAFQDLLALPIRLNDQISGLAAAAASADTRPTQQTYDVYTTLSVLVDFQLEKLKKILLEQVPAFNQLTESRKMPVLNVDKK
jgi:photosystem II stability/assembly factor-like uncharacterized protein